MVVLTASALIVHSILLFYNVFKKHEILDSICKIFLVLAALQYFNFYQLKNVVCLNRYLKHFRIHLHLACQIKTTLLAAKAPKTAEGAAKVLKNS
jgi:hypothetical protein